MQKWLQKEHVGHNQLNARWIKGGGGVGMKMTESKAVKNTKNDGVRAGKRKGNGEGIGC